MFTSYYKDYKETEVEQVSFTNIHVQNPER